MLGKYSYDTREIIAIDNGNRKTSGRALLNESLLTGARQTLYIIKKFSSCIPLSKTNGTISLLAIYIGIIDFSNCEHARVIINCRPICMRQRYPMYDQFDGTGKVERPVCQQHCTQDRYYLYYTPLTWFNDNLPLFLSLQVPCFQPNDYPYIHPPVLSGPRPQHFFPSWVARRAWVARLVEHRRNARRRICSSTVTHERDFAAPYDISPSIRHSSHDETNECGRQRTIGCE